MRGRLRRPLRMRLFLEESCALEDSVAKREKRGTGPDAGSPRKKATNLTLDSEAVSRAERYGAQHGRKVSQLVNSFLSALPDVRQPSVAAELSPAVRRLYGLAAAGDATRDDYRAHLGWKYGDSR